MQRMRAVAGALVVACALLSPTWVASAAPIWELPQPTMAATSLDGRLASIASATICEQISVDSLRWFDTYARSRILPVNYATGNNISEGPWTARPDVGAADAAADGSITEWADNYYITHDWSPYGKAILNLIPNDRVTINGRTIVVDRIFDYPKASFQNEIEYLAGDETDAIFQTCEPNMDYNRIVFGHNA